VCLAAGPSYARAWRKDPDELAEEAELFASNPGFDATLRHMRDAQPRGLTTLDSAGADPVGHARRDPAPAPGPPLRAADPRRGAPLHPRIGHTPMSDAPEELAEAIAEFALERAPALAPL
jgi:hypothetical protein